MESAWLQLIAVLCIGVCQYWCFHLQPKVPFQQC